ncbi:MAG: flagellar basal-body MS-ring/collar protein FliF [Gemmatimonadales bacterium]|nr:flagellar basal-body MS-ring/collar protein FliF [Gemmatimonadales bacterium]MDZ4257274.1 flagellar basal-body MS-ring/collar protein FliF [Gemmatimonadales bacterium]MDZ4388963.1 flagellar basal-body MS-ring/collar protein FliF [Gemmatimonadales bacterium]
MPNFLGRLNANGRMAALGVVAVLLVAAVMFGRAATSPNYVPLFRGLDMAEAGNISDALTRASIPFRLEAGGADVVVPEADAARARVLLAKDGLPSSGRPGLELFDRPAWGMTDFTEQVTYRRAMEGELARTIGTLRGVQRAQVHLALPEGSALRRTDRPAEAAVVVALRANASLTADQVRGIAQLVSSSVTGLSPERVAVLDDSGTPLSGAAMDDGGTALSTHQHELQGGVEGALAAKVTTMLAAALGPEAVRVQVSARLNFDQVDRTIEAYDTLGQVLRTEQRSQTGAADAQGGGTSVLSNEYLNSRTVERVIGAPGTVTRLTVSAMVDSRALGSEGTMQDADRERLETVIRDAIGYDEARGDRVTVVAVPFKGVEVAAVATDDPETFGSGGPGALEWVQRLAFPLLGGIALVMAFLLGSRALKTLPAPALAADQGRGSADLSSGISGGGTFERQRAQTEVLEQPQTAARVLRTWLTEPS